MTMNAEKYDEPDAGSDGTSDGSAAARLLEMTARETDQWRADARNEAAEIVREARAEAERLVDEARVEAYRVREDAARVEGVAAEHREGLRRHLTEMLDRIDQPDQ